MQNSDPFSVRFLFAKMLRWSAATDKANFTLRQLGDTEEINTNWLGTNPFQLLRPRGVTTPLSLAEKEYFKTLIKKYSSKFVF